MHRLAGFATAVYILVLPSEPEPWMSALEPMASPARLARARGYLHQADALRCLAAEALLRQALAEIFDLPGDSVMLDSDEWGKPRLAGLPGIHFNLSHSGQWVLCAVHHGPVGIDVEEVRPLPALPAEMVMAPDERRTFAGLAGSRAIDFFFRLWTLKESLLKAMGCGLSIDPRCISLNPMAPTSTIQLSREPESRWRLVRLPMPEGVEAALCCWPSPNPAPSSRP
jgi:phosphopantetheine--protein transferase-like protein